MSDRIASDPQARQLSQIGYAGLVGACIWFANKLEWADPVLTITSLAMLVFGALPMIRWIGHSEETYPITEFMLLVTVPFYALPLMTGHEETQRYSEAILLQACFVVLTFQLSCIGGHALASKSYRRGPQREKSFWRTEILPEERMKFTAYTLMLNSAWLFVTNFTTWFENDLVGTFRAIFFGIGIISAFIQARLWGSGRLNAFEKSLFWFNLLFQIILTFRSLLLINGIGLLLTALAGYFTVARRVPWLPFALFLPILAILHNGKSEMRKIYWSEANEELRIDSTAEFFLQWIEFGLPGGSQSDETTDSDREKLTYGLLRRASLFQMVCVAVDRIPARHDYLFPDSYTLIPALFIPRPLWPGKPSPQESVTLLSVELGLLTADQAKATSIGFGMLAEAYANHGLLCVAALGFIFGYLLRLLAISTLDCATISLPGLLRILCIVWCFSAETTLAVWISSLYQACMAICVPLIGWKKLSEG